MEPGLAQDILKTWDAEAWSGLTEDEKNLMSCEEWTAIMANIFHNSRMR